MTDAPKPLTREDVESHLEALRAAFAALKEVILKLEDDNARLRRYRERTRGFECPQGHGLNMDADDIAREEGCE